MTTRRNFIALTGAAMTLPLAAPVQAAIARPQVTQIRNATLWIDYAGTRFLVDPMLADRYAFPGFPGTANSELRNPAGYLPFPVDEIIKVDAVILTHLHEDHWDKPAQDALPKDVPVFVQNQADAEILHDQGFTDVRVLAGSADFNGVTLTRTEGTHGTPAAIAAAGDLLGQVMGVAFAAEGQPVIYLAGDTIWNQQVRDALDTHRPEVVILNAGYAMLPGVGPIIMGAEDVKAVADAAPNATLIATHMESVNHCILTRAELRSFARQNGFADRLYVPGDGQMIQL
ncbi:MAG: MBL fold metallo-hydrolase [Paracoccus sp. (in: a-proteobacteria)]|uniref:MBL fold metallo-hydrolase n=1 Tax=Paracoccus sp. TaxID=267 RepID=UPI0026DF96C5|nr:MBL fold metallo-hydrolase [Paracoccus sp. (in: a-proteobacteria)]MDO5620396.1 MBL fold metallo-hydrolase [Paracoccus sp. (in: a-proteobacteria)]